MGNSILKFGIWGFILIFSSNTNFLKAQIKGCNDTKAINYNSLATSNDGSCTYNSASEAPVNSTELAAVMNETSGLIQWNGKVWTHNDDTDTNIYSFDPANPTAYTAYKLNGVVNTEWEDMAQDNDYIYLGDFGNNANGNRTNLRILKISKSSLLQNNPTVETIQFNYQTQTNFAATGANKTDLDCEALIVSDDSIFLFTKEWISKKTSLFALPKTAGNHIAKYMGSYNVEGLITGATYLKNKNLIALCGYTESLQPFVVLLYDFKKNNFLAANKRKISLNLLYHQVEGISTLDGENYFISNEKITQSYFTVPPKIHTLNLSAYLADYLRAYTHIETVKNYFSGIKVAPNPAHETLKIDVPNSLNSQVRIYNTSGQLAGAFSTCNGTLHLSVENLCCGLYSYVIDMPSFHSYSGKFLVQK